MFLKNKNIIFKIRRSKVTDYAALTLESAKKKKCIWKCHLLKSSAANNCLTLLTNLSIEANSVVPDQTAPIEAV